MNTKSRSESLIFADLESLCKENGYAHALAYLCYRDATIKFTKTLSFNDISDSYGFNKLIRNELSALVGLMIKGAMDFTHPGMEKIAELSNKTEELLEELHYKIAEPLIHRSSIDVQGVVEGYILNPLNQGAILRESILYGSESAYYFQYQELIKEKYKNDTEWLLINKKFDIENLYRVFGGIVSIRHRKSTEFARGLNSTSSNDITYLNSLMFTEDELILESKVEKDTVKAILDSFKLNEKDGANNEGYKNIDDFNILNAYPIIQIKDDTYIIFITNSLFEASYETPFFWLCADKKYQPTAMKNRGNFTEEYSARKLENVFGSDNVFKNVNIFQGTKLAGEIDILVIYAGRAIILQAKSKKLTINARRGDDSALKNDFKNAIQKAYDQGYSCSELLESPQSKLVKENGEELKLNGELSEIFILCVLSEHYPALVFQSRQFLIAHEHEKIKYPFVTDVFFIDIICEFLKSPLYFLSYLSQRTHYNFQILSSNELVVLGYHLSNNLWIDKENEKSLFVLDNNLSGSIDIAMYSRRLNLQGEKIPNGILTRFNNTLFERVVRELSYINNENAYELGKFLLTMSEQTINDFNDQGKISIDKSKVDNKHHDLTMFVDNIGIIIHSNNNSFDAALMYLKAHCAARKFKMKSDLCYGLLLPLNSQHPPTLVIFDRPWLHSQEESDASEKFFIKKNLLPLKDKIGKNSPCPCNSGKKYKKCCLKHK